MSRTSQEAWNERLVDALQFRADQKRQQGKQTYISFQQAARQIESVRKDIYAFQNGRVVNLPNELSITMIDLCHKIVNEKDPVLPPGWIPTRPEHTQDGVDSYATHPYLTRIKLRGGAFAVLMAFHMSERKTLTKDEIIRAGQRFCDEQLDTNFHSGRMYGAWKGHETLKKHDLITVNSTLAFRDGRRFLAAGKSTYTITADGERFTKALLDRHPEIRQEVEGMRSPSVVTPSMTIPSISVPRTPIRSLQGAYAVRRASINELSRKDITALHEWVKTAQIGNQKAFAVGKLRRKCLHDACDDLNSTIRSLGKQLIHETLECRSRSSSIFITLRPATTTATSPLHYQDADTSYGVMDDVHASTHHTDCCASENLAINHDSLERRTTSQSSCDHQRLAGISNHRTKQTPQKALAQDLIKKSVIIDEFPSCLTHTILKEKEVLDLLRDSSDEEELLKPCTGSDLSTRSRQKLDLTVSKNVHYGGGTFTIFIDNRERNRNATPRLLRIELSRLLFSSLFSSVVCRLRTGFKVKEQELLCGDFCFSFHHDDMIAPIVERKTVADLVQRSQRSDHWKQFLRMQNCVQTGVFFFLVEGDLRTAVRYTAFGAHDAELWQPNGHIIDSEEGVLRFFARAILRSRRVRFIQSKDVQGSLRSIAALGLVVAASAKQHQILPATFRDPTRSMFSFLRNRGLPHQIAGIVADEFGCTRDLEQLFDLAADEDCKQRILTAVFEASGEDKILGGSPRMWSKATLTAVKREPKRKSPIAEDFERLRVMVDDQALLFTSLYEFGTNGEALNYVLENQGVIEEPSCRCVTVSLPNGYEELFVSEANSVFNVRKNPCRLRTPCITIQSFEGDFESEKLMLFIVEAKDLCRRLSTCLASTTNSLLAAQKCASELKQDLHSPLSDNPSVDRWVVVVRGLSSAMNQWARTVGYRSEYRGAVDLLFADLSSSHGLVVIEAVRLGGDLQSIVQQFALACYNFQLITQRADEQKCMEILSYDGFRC